MGSSTPQAARRWNLHFAIPASFHHGSTASRAWFSILAGKASRTRWPCTSVQDLAHAHRPTGAATPRTKGLNRSGSVGTGQRASPPKVAGRQTAITRSATRPLATITATFTHAIIWAVNSAGCRGHRRLTAPPYGGTRFHAASSVLEFAEPLDGEFAAGRLPGCGWTRPRRSRVAKLVPMLRRSSAIPCSARASCIDLKAISEIAAFGFQRLASEWDPARHTCSVTRLCALAFSVPNTFDKVLWSLAHRPRLIAIRDIGIQSAV